MNILRGIITNPRHDKKCHDTENTGKDKNYFTQPYKDRSHGIASHT